MSKTLLLDLNAWDLVLDSSGNIALASEPYSVVQDVASALRTFAGECWYNTLLGVPYWQQILGKSPPLELLKAQFVAAALTVPSVTSARCFITSYVGRAITGQVIIEYTPNVDGTTQPGAATGSFGVITFYGTNTGVVTFVGDNGGILGFTGTVP